MITTKLNTILIKTTKFQLKLKECMYIGRRNPDLNKKVKYVLSTLSVYPSSLCLFLFLLIAITSLTMFLTFIFVSFCFVFLLNYFHC